MAKYSYQNFILDKGHLRIDLRYKLRQSGLTMLEVDALLGTRVIGNMMSATAEDYMPTLRNYLSLCNLFDLDPRTYLVLEEDELPF